MPLTDVQRVRYTIGDTATPPHFGDADLEAYIEIAGGDLDEASAVALEAWATQLAAVAHDVTLGDYRENTRGAAEAMRQAAAALRENARTRPAMAIASSHTGPGSASWQDILMNRAVTGAL